MSSGIGDLLHARRDRVLAAHRQRVADGSAPACPPWCRHDEPGVGSGWVWHRTEATTVTAVSGDRVTVFVEQFDETDAGPEPANIQLQICDALVLLTDRQTEAVIAALQANLTTLRAVSQVTR